MPTSQPASHAGSQAARLDLAAPFVPTPATVRDRMLTLARLEPRDLLADLGAGDGAVLIAAAQAYGCRGLGWEHDSELANAAELRVRAAGLQDRIRILRGDALLADLAGVTAVFVYLLPNQMARLRPRLDTLLAGARIVSHDFLLPGLPPEMAERVESPEDGECHWVYRWTAPLAAAAAASST